MAFFAITLIHVKKESTDSNLSDIDLDSHVMIIASWPEHHFDDMISKEYKFSHINNLLIQNNFKQIFKIKMPFRKTFEYIYLNKTY